MRWVEKRIIMFVVAGALALCLAGSAQAVPNMINYQGKLLKNGDPLTTAAPISMTFKIFIEETDTGGSPIWVESQDVEVVDGMYEVKLGVVNPLDSSLFEDPGRDYWLEVTVGTETLALRQRLTSVAFALQAENAATLDGYTASELDQSAHVTRTDNPHNVTAAQIGATTLAELTWGNLSGIPAGLDDGDDVGITEETDPTVPASVKDGISWSEVSGIPSGFADGVDNDSGGDITAVTAGTGLSGGSDIGNATLDVTVPLELSGDNGDTATIKGQKLGSNGSGVRGEHFSTGNVGMLGTSFAGVFGAGHGTANGVYGSNENGNYGYLGGAMYSVWASAHDSSSWAGYFLGKTTVSGGNFELRNPTGENWLSFLRGNGQNAGFAFKEDGVADTQWIFPYFRGWQGDNLIIRDEAAHKDVMTFEAGTGRVGIGTDEPETLLHVSAGTSGDAVLLLEADTDNNNEDDQPAVQFKQDGGLVTGSVGFDEGSNNLRVRSSEDIQFIVRDDDNKDVLVATMDDTGSMRVAGNVQIDGDLSVTRESYYVVAPSDFVTPLVEGIHYDDSKVELRPNGLVNMATYLVAPVHLPQGAEIIKITCWWEDNIANSCLLYLKRASLNSGIVEEMAEMESYWDDDARHLQYVPDQSSPYASDSIAHNIIDNAGYSYSMTVFLRAAEDDNNTAALGGVRIQYRYNP